MKYETTKSDKQNCKRKRRRRLNLIECEIFNPHSHSTHTRNAVYVRAVFFSSVVSVFKRQAHHTDFLRHFSIEIVSFHTIFIHFAKHLFSKQDRRRRKNHRIVNVHFVHTHTYLT